METRDIRELKKTLTMAESTATEIRCCYISVTEDGPKLSTMQTKRVASMEKEELLKYFGLFGKILGTVDKKVFEREPENEDTGKLLTAMANGGLTDELCETFFAEVARLHKKRENIAVFLIRGVYDVPVRTSDNIKNDESDVSYPHIICAICPSRLTGAGISYDMEGGQFTTLDQQHEIKAPATGLVFPALTDREPDFDSGMIYIANEKALEDNIIVSLFGCEAPVLPKKPEPRSGSLPGAPGAGPGAGALAAGGQALGAGYGLPDDGAVRRKDELIPDYDETAFTHPRYKEGAELPSASALSDAALANSALSGGGDLVSPGEGAFHQGSASADVPWESSSSVDDFQNYKKNAAYSTGVEGGSISERDPSEPSVNEVLQGAVQHKKRFTEWASDGSAKLMVSIPGAARMLALYEDLGTLEELRALISKTEGRSQ